MTDIEKVLGADFRIPRDVEALKKAILDDKKELLRLQKIINSIIENGIPHNSFSEDCCDGTNEDLKKEIKRLFYGVS